MSDPNDENDDLSLDYVVAGGEGFRCLRCGTEQSLAYPLSINVWVGSGEGFAKDHRHCEPNDPRGQARFEYSSPEEWARSWDTGTSSLYVRYVLGGGPRPKEHGQEPIPYDPSDFGRCYRLLAVAPGWTERLDEVANACPAWTPFADAWPELVALWKEESPSGEAPKLFKRLQELVRRSRKVMGEAV